MKLQPRGHYIEHLTQDWRFGIVHVSPKSFFDTSSMRKREIDVLLFVFP